MSNSVASLPNESPGQWLTRQLERRDMSVRRFADAMQVTTQTVYAWQNNRTVINEGRVPQLAGALGISEIEARRMLGYWVPDGTESPGTDTTDLDAVEALLEQAMAELNRLKQKRTG